MKTGSPVAGMWQKTWGNPAMQAREACLEVSMWSLRIGKLKEISLTLSARQWKRYHWRMDRTTDRGSFDIHIQGVWSSLMSGLKNWEKPLATLGLGSSDLSLGKQYKWERLPDRQACGAAKAKNKERSRHIDPKLATGKILISASNTLKPLWTESN